MRVLRDTNVILSAILFCGTPRDLLRRVIDGRLTLVTSAHLLEEMEDILSSKFAFTRAAADEILTPAVVALRLAGKND